MVGTIVGIAAEAGVSKALGYAMKALTPSNATKISKLLVKVGVWGSAMLIGAGVKESIDDSLGKVNLTAATTEGSVKVVIENETEDEAV